MYKRILILSASVGNGHVTAAEALKKAFEIQGLAGEVRHEDVLKFTNPLFRRLYSNAYIGLVNSMPEVLGWMYDNLDEPWKNEKRRLFFDKLNTRPLVKMLREYDPDWIVCTHFLPSEIISDLKGKGKMTAPQAIVVTDFDMHAMWLCRNYEHYFVALDETAVYLRHWVTRGEDDRSGIPSIPNLPRKNRPVRCVPNTAWILICRPSCFRLAALALDELKRSSMGCGPSTRRCRSWQCAEKTKS